MPHSSGGGSHSSGSHSGSSSSSYSSRSGSGGSSRSNSAPMRRYVYYSGGRPHYYYSTGGIKTRPKKYEYVLLVILIAIWAAVLIWLLPAAVSHPKKLAFPSDSAIQIRDTIDVMSDAEERRLYASLETFQRETGITPAVITVYNSDWESYSALEHYAYDLYVNAYPDETHWLIVYSQPEIPEDFNDWYWEGMQGDDTDDILTEKVTNTFTATVQRGLLDNKVSVAQALADGFDTITPGIMKKSLAWDSLAVVLLFSSVFAVCPVVLGCSIALRLRRANSYPTKNETREDNCEYCGGLYVHGIHTACPHCGAPIRAKTEE